MTSEAFLARCPAVGSPVKRKKSNVVCIVKTKGIVMTNIILISTYCGFKDMYLSRRRRAKHLQFDWGYLLSMKADYPTCMQCLSEAH